MAWSETQRAVGKAQGARHILLLQLAHQYGPLPEKVRQQVEAISSLDRLIELAGRVLAAGPSKRWASPRNPAAGEKAGRY